MAPPGTTPWPPSRRRTPRGSSGGPITPSGAVPARVWNGPHSPAERWGPNLLEGDGDTVELCRRFRSSRFGGWAYFKLRGLGLGSAVALGGLAPSPVEPPRAPRAQSSVRRQTQRVPRPSTSDCELCRSGVPRDQAGSSPNSPASTTRSTPGEAPCRHRIPGGHEQRDPPSNRREPPTFRSPDPWLPARTSPSSPSTSPCPSTAASTTPPPNASCCPTPKASTASTRYGQNDAILIGANTMRRDNLRLLVNSAERRTARVERGLPEYPLKVTITAGGDLDAGLVDGSASSSPRSSSSATTPRGS